MNLTVSIIITSFRHAEHYFNLPYFHPLSTATTQWLHCRSWKCGRETERFPSSSLPHSHPEILLSPFPHISLRHQTLPTGPEPRQTKRDGQSELAEQRRPRPFHA